MSQVPSTLEERASAHRGRRALARPLERSTARHGHQACAALAAPRLSELWHFRELLWTLVWRDVVVRYKQTFLGIAWAILVPVFTALVYIVVFGRFADFPSGGHAVPVLVIAGVLPMQYFASALTRLEHEPGREPRARDEGLLPAHVAPARCRDRPAGRLRRRPARARRDDVVLDTWPGGSRCSSRPLFSALAVMTALGLGLLPLGHERPLSRRPLHDPGLPPGAAAPLRRHVRRQRDPGEVAVDPRVQPDDHGHQRLALGGGRRNRARSRARSRVGVASPSCSSSSGSACSDRRSRASRTRSDGDRDRGRGDLEAIPDRRAPGRLRDAPRVDRRTPAGGSPGRSTSRGTGDLGARRRLVRGRRRARCSA